MFLSHQLGEESGAESRMLAKALHVSEKWLRVSAHVLLFSVLSFLMLSAFPELPLWIRAAIIGVWACMDEWTKGWSLFPGRHFSWQDVGWNALGWAVGIGVWLTSTLI